MAAIVNIVVFSQNITNRLRTLKQSRRNAIGLWQLSTSTLSFNSLLKIAENLRQMMKIIFLISCHQGIGTSHTLKVTISQSMVAKLLKHLLQCPRLSPLNTKSYPKKTEDRLPQKLAQRSLLKVLENMNKKQIRAFVH